MPRQQDGTRSSEDHDLRRHSGRRAKGNETKTSNSEQEQAAQGQEVHVFQEDSSAKMEIEGALKRAEAQESAPTRVDPDARVGAARDRVARVEQAIFTFPPRSRRSWSGCQTDRKT